MSDFRKARVVIDAVYRNGDAFKQQHAVPARVSVLPIPGAEKFRELNLRLVVEPGISEELLEGLVRGTVNLSIEQMQTPAERETNS